MRHFEVAIGHVVVANERTAIGPNGHGGVLTDLASIIQGGEIGGGAEPVGAAGHFEVAIGHVAVADQAQAVGSNGHGGVLTNLACVVQGGELGGSAEPVGAVRYLEVPLVASW